ncbi:MAG: hypothetical protein CSA76_02415 [Spirochaetales bacterium]|nr:MAG: hypothetical protein CSA76_02415 [Spirochaetales bacterium]
MKRMKSMEAIDHVLGDTPSWKTVQRLSRRLKAAEEELFLLSNSDSQYERRVARLLLLTEREGHREDARLFAGLNDSYYRVRSDAARLSASGDDRTRLYNRLIRLIREDPHIKVRRAAGARLSHDFADLYTLEFDRLPPLSRMLILDALEGHNSLDETRAEKLLLEETGEPAYRAGRRLDDWGTLTRLFLFTGEMNSEEAKSILNKAADLGVSGFLERLSPGSLKQEHLLSAIELSQRAGREDLKELFESRLKSG